MCGFSGFIDPGMREPNTLRATVSTMANAIAHRGPDAQGEWIEPRIGLALGSRRLAIQDLSAQGHQPMQSRSGRLVIAYNGEIYNATELRQRLEHLEPSFTWRGHSDTEVLLETCERLGVKGALRAAVGMFGFALWDRATRTLTLARDRFGEKPVYYGSQGCTLLFGSELKALASHPAFRGEIRTDAVQAFLRRGFVPGQASVYRGIGKLPPASLVATSLDAEGNVQGWSQPTTYWSAVETALDARQRPYRNANEAREAVEHSIAAAVRSRLVADVPIGAFLSGGIDSSLVVAHMQTASGHPALTFTISYDEGDFDESVHAQTVADVLGTRHASHRVTPDEAARVIDELSRIYDEPFADPSQLPTVLVSRFARQHVTVALTGDGGDELFGGYTRYFDGQRAWDRISRLPASVRMAAAGALRSMPASGWNSGLRTLRGLPGAPALRGWTGERMHRLADALRARNAREMYAGVMSRSHAVGAFAPADALPQDAEALAWRDDVSLPEAMMLADTLGILVDGFLVKVDRAAMSAGLETRAPLLDPGVFEAAWRLPLSERIGAESGKQVLRELLSKHVPRGIVERPKQGFGVPLGAWLRGPMRPWAEELLGQRALAANDFINVAAVRRLWLEHCAGRHDHEHSLWSVLMLQNWLHQLPRVTQAQGITFAAGPSRLALEAS